jgi:hypothetical protein
MQPLGPVWRLVDQFAELWLDPPWQTAFPMLSPSSRISPYRTWYSEAAYQDRFHNKARFRHVAMEGRHAAGELEGFPAPLSGVVPDLSFARDNVQEIRPPASVVNKLTSNIRHLTINFTAHSIQYV